MKNELRRKTMKKLAVFRSTTYSYLTEDGD